MSLNVEPESAQPEPAGIRRVIWANAPESKPISKDDLETLPIAELQTKLGSSPDGLTEAEAQKRLMQHGPNEIEEKRINTFLKVLT